MGGVRAVGVSVCARLLSIGRSGGIEAAPET